MLYPDSECLSKHHFHFRFEPCNDGSEHLNIDFESPPPAKYIPNPFPEHKKVGKNTHCSR